MDRLLMLPVSIVCLLGSLSTGFGQESAGLPAQIVAGWRDYADRLNHAEVTIENLEEHTTISTERRQSKGSSTSKVAFNGANRRAEHSFEVPGLKERRVYGCNAQYAFRLEWRNTGWILVEYARTGSAPAKDIEASLLTFYQLACSPISIAEDPLATLAGNLRVRPGRQDVLELATPFKSVGSRHDKTYQTMTINLNDDAFRTVKSMSGTYVIKNLSNPRTSFTIALESKVVDGVPVLQSSVTEETFTSSRSSGSSTTRNTYQIDPTIARPESDFRLSAYGLPEPKDATPIATPSRYRWFLLGAALFAVIAVALRYLARRQQKSETVGSNT